MLHHFYIPHPLVYALIAPCCQKVIMRYFDSEKLIGNDTLPFVFHVYFCIKFYHTDYINLCSFSAVFVLLHEIKNSCQNCLNTNFRFLSIPECIGKNNNKNYYLPFIIVCLERGQNCVIVNKHYEWLLKLSLCNVARAFLGQATRIHALKQHTLM